MDEGPPIRVGKRPEIWPPPTSGNSGRCSRGAGMAVTGLVAAGALQREGFERGELAVRPHHVVIGDLDRGNAAAIRPGIEGECREAVGMRGIAHRRPGRLFLHVDRWTLAGLRVGFAARGDPPPRPRVYEP